MTPRCSCFDRPELAPTRPADRLERFVSDLEAHGATVHETTHDAIRRAVAHTSDDGQNPFARRKR